MKTYHHSLWLLPWLCFCCLLMTTALLHAQEPPPHLKLVFSDTTISNVSEQYELSTFMNRAADFGEPEVMDEKMRERLPVNQGNGFIRVYLYGYKIHLPLRGDIYSFTLKQQTSGESMTVFVRTSYSLDYSEEIVIENITFMQGIYFLDMCKSNSKFQIPAGKTDNTIIDLQGLKKYKTSIRKISKLLNRNCC